MNTVKYQIQMSEEVRMCGFKFLVAGRRLEIKGERRKRQN